MDECGTGFLGCFLGRDFLTVGSASPSMLPEMERGVDCLEGALLTGFVIALLG